LKEGLLIAQSSAFTVFFFVPLGSILSTYIGAPISEYLTILDKEAGWKIEAMKYSRKSIHYVKPDPILAIGGGKNDGEGDGGEGERDEEDPSFG
jgi:hypothetical protein